MCFHDGPGIRTTVFLKGCTLHCPWCSNPENLNYQFDRYTLNDKDGIYGYDIDCQDLIKEIYKDKAFWGDEGGVTFSGGEALLQSTELLPVLKQLKKDNVNVAIETALGVAQEKLLEVIDYIDYFIVDIKILEEHEAKNILGLEVKQYLENIERIYSSNKLKLLRMPCCKEFTLKRTNLEIIKQTLSRYRDVPLEIFKIHSLGEKKYKSLEKEMWLSEPLSDEDMGLLKCEFESVVDKVSIIKI